MLHDELVNRVLINPIRSGAQKLAIVSGYASPNMASWHIKRIRHLNLSTIDISLIVGMCPHDGLTLSAHEGFGALHALNDSQYSSLSCQYIYQGGETHSKIYVWLKNEEPFCAFTGSANYTQAAFSAKRREYMVNCDPVAAYQYYQSLTGDTIVCNHAEVEDYIALQREHPILDAENLLAEKQSNSVTLSLLKKSGDVGFGSGINWGHRQNKTKRDKNQAYIPLPTKIAQSGFFPLSKQHFSVITDDRKFLIMRVEQQNDKAITTPLNNASLGEYIRNRIGAANGAFVTKQDLEKYGRTTVVFTKLEDEQFYMDFSI